MASRQHVISWGGLAMIVGGLFWVLKAGVILLANYQPPLIYEVAPLLFALGLLGLYAQLAPHAGRIGTVGAVLVGLAFGSRLAATVYETVPGARISTGEDFVFPYSLLVLIGTLGIFVGLLLLGIAALRSERLPSPFHLTPLAVALLVIPLLGTGFLHIEFPILLIGCLWMLLGYTIWWSARSKAKIAR